MNRSFRTPKFEDIVKELADSLGVGIGNAIEKAKDGKFTDAIKEIKNGLVLNGKSSAKLTALLSAANLEWSIQDGQLQVVERGKALKLDPVVLSPSTGLIGSPDRGEKGRVEVVSLLQPTIIPGRRIRIQSQYVNGDYRAEVVEHDGDTRGQAFETRVEASPL